MTEKNRQKTSQKKTRKQNAPWFGNRDKPSLGIIAIVALCAFAAILVGFGMQRLFDAARSGSASEALPSVRINEVMTENVSALITDTGDVPDWIEVANTGSKSVNLKRYALLIQSNINKIYTFPDLTLEPGGYVVVYADGLTGDGDGAHHAPFKIGASGGETLMLLNPQGSVIDGVKLPELRGDESYSRSAGGEWQVTAAATPNAQNVMAASTGETVADKVKVTPEAIEITEAMTSNTLYFPDESGTPTDYIEVHNRSDETVSLDGWYLSDSSDKLKRWSFPNVTLGPDGYLAVHCSGENRTNNPAHLHTDFRLSSKGETLYLSRPDGQTAASVKVPALLDDQAYSLVSGEWTTDLGPTPGYANTVESANAVNAQRFTGGNGVLINEIMASPTQQSSDWIELYNASSMAVDLSGCGLTDESSKPRKYRFPSGTVLQPGAYLGVFLTGQDAETVNGYLNADFALSPEGGYTVCLSNTDGKIIDAVYLPRQYGGVSYGRMPGRSDWYYFSEGTPNQPNAGNAYYGKAAAPTYSVRGGLFKTGDAFTVELSAPAGSRIYYTLDSSDPDEGDRLYTDPIEVASTTILRTRVYRDGYMESYMDTQSYLFDVNNPEGVFVVSLVSDPYNLTSDEAGIMVKGPNATDKFPYGSLGKGANFWMDWEREAHIELFTADSKQLISQECGIKLHGQYSRAAEVKAFKVYARNEYGANRFEYPIFSNRDYGEYQSFLLRASGQDYNMTFMRDSVLTSLARDTSVMYQETEIAIVYIDGQYYSPMYLRERISKFSICQFEGWEGMEDDLDIIKANSSVKQGSNETFAKFLAYVKTCDPTDNAFYQALDSVIDIQNYIEYMSLEIFSGNGDTLNVKRYRNAKKDGKWRWVLFDLDWAFDVDTNSIARWLAPGGMGTNKYTDNTLFIACMKNPTFRDRFLTYFGQQMATTFTTENVMALFEERYNRIDGLMPDYLPKVGMTQESYKKQLGKLINYVKTRPGKLLEYFDGVFHFSDAEKQKYFGAAIEKINATN